MLGNFSISDMEEKLGISFPEELKEIMIPNRQEDVSKQIKSGKWHCFHLPFCIVCGDMEFAKEIHKHLLPLASEMAGALQITWLSNKTEKPEE